MDKKLTIIGGDKRNVKLAEMLVNDGYEVYTYGLDDVVLSNSKLIKLDNLGEAIDKSKYIIGPIPFTNKENEIKMPFSQKKITVKDISEHISNKVLIAGSIKDDDSKIIEQKAGRVIDILKNEELAVLNAITTAEGALSIAISESEKNLNGSNILIIGFGRIGKILSKMLNALGANVFCAARKNDDIAWIKAYGYKEIRLNEIDKNIDSYDFIFNTAPALILDEKRLDNINKNCLVIDLASNPGGIDRKSAEQKNVKFIWALGLPGKISPTTSAEFLKKAIYSIIEE